MKNIFKAPAGLLKKQGDSKKLRKKKTAPSDIVYSPAEISTEGSRITGIILRSIILFLGTFGLSAFLLDFCGLTVNEIYWAGFYVPLWVIALSALGLSAVFGFASYRKKTALIAYPSGIVLLMAVFTIMNGNPIQFIIDSCVRIYNFTIYTMVSRGYMYFGDYMLKELYDYSNSAYVTSDIYRIGGSIIVTVVIGALLGIAIMKKVRLWLLVPCVALIMSPVLIFNIFNSSLGFALTLAFLAATVTVYIYDYRFAGALEAKNERIRKRLEKKEQKRLEKLRRREEKRALKDEADRMLMAALKADMGAKKSRLAKKAVFKADRLAKKNAKKAKKRKIKAEKKQKKLDVKKEKAENKLLKKEASAGNVSATEALKAKSRLKDEKRAAKKSKKIEQNRIKRERQHKAHLVSAAGGFAGIGAAVLALIAVGLPALAVSKPFPEIAPIYNRVNIASEYVTVYLSGNDIDLNNLSAYAIEELMPRTLSFEALEFEEIPMFSVSTTADNNIYLKSWIGDSYDYYSDTWIGADYDKVLSFRQRFGQGFTPDSITTAFKKYVYPSTADITESSVYKNFSKFGFTMQSVDVNRLDGYSRLMLIPSVMDTDIGLLQKGTLDKIDKKFSNYYDGVYSSRFFEAGDPYKTVSYITRMNRNGIAAEYLNAMTYYNTSVQTIDTLKALIEAGETDIDGYIYDYEMGLQDNGISYVGTSLADRYFNEMTEEEQKAFDIAVDTEENYRNFVYENYSVSFESDKISKLAKEIKAQAEVDVITTRHDLIVSVINYLGDNCAYTKTPNKELYPGAGSIIDSFLFDVKEGYCTHFATAACAILREFGIPVRFAEGYIATDFTENRSDYGSVVLDSDAHAWIEVYYDGMGWITYEVTPGYTEDMYTPDGATIEPVDPNTGETLPNTPPPEEEKEEDNDDVEDDYVEEKSEIELFIIVVSCVLAGLVLIFIMRLIIKRFVRRGTTMLEARYDLINRARDAEVWKNPQTDRHSIARRLNDQIIDIFEVIGAAPEAGEVSSEYAKRIATNYGDLSKINAQEVFAAIQKEEFGNGLNFEETAMLAEYLADITASVYAGLSRFQKIKYRYIKRKI